MTREDVQKLLAMIQTVYPNYKPIDKTAAVNAWILALEDFNKNEVALAFKSYMTTNTTGFAPVPGQLIELIQTITNPQELNEMEAWSLVRKAISHSGYDSVEEFAKLPPEVQKAVGTPEQLRSWAIDEDFNEEVASSNFMRCYRTEVKRQREIAKMPQDIRELIEQANIGSYPSRLDQSRSRMIADHRETKQLENEQITDGVPMPERLRSVYDDL